MTDHNGASPPPVTEAELTELRSRAEGLEQQLTELQRQTETRLIMSELKTEAIRAGIVDLDGLRLVDISDLKVDRNGEIPGTTELIADLRRRKPWLFGGGSSSSVAGVPNAQPPRAKMALEMSEEEYRAARAALLKRRS